MTDIHDQKFKTLYLETAREYVGALSRDLTSLALEANNPNYVSQIRISAHSLKGQSNAVGYVHIAAIAHMIEEVARQFLEEQHSILPAEIYAMQSSLSALSSSLSTIEQENHEADLTQAEEELKGALKR